MSGRGGVDRSIRRLAKVGDHAVRMVLLETIVEVVRPGGTVLRVVPKGARKRVR